MNAMTGMGGGAAMGPAIKATGPTQTDLDTTMRYDEKQRAPFEEDEDPDNEVVQVQEWIPEVHLTPLTTLTFICRRASGKTNAIRDICERYFRHHIKHFVLFSPTADADSGAYPFIDRRFVFPRPSSLILRRIEARQKRLLQKNMLKEKGPSGITRASKRVCMIFDDHFDMMDQQTQSELARMMSIGRHRFPSKRATRGRNSRLRQISADFRGHLVSEEFWTNCGVLGSGRYMLSHPRYRSSD